MQMEREQGEFEPCCRVLSRRQREAERAERRQKRRKPDDENRSNIVETCMCYIGLAILAIQFMLTSPWFWQVVKKMVKERINELWKRMQKKPVNNKYRRCKTGTHSRVHRTHSQIPVVHRTYPQNPCT